MAKKAKMAGTDKTARNITGGPSIILAEPQLGENIGTTARAMGNFGLTDLRLVDPRDGWPNPAARKAASGADWIIDNARVFETAEQAVGDFHYVFAATARDRDMVKPVATPEQAAVHCAARIDAGERVALLLGRERTGLTNDQVVLADTVLSIPVNPAFSSLNLAQAVLVFGYEWFKYTNTESGAQRAAPAPVSADAATLDLHKTRPAEKNEMIGLFEHLESELDDAGFLLPVEKRPAMVRNIRNLFQRTGLTEQDVRTLRGIVATLSRARRARRS